MTKQEFLDELRLALEGEVSSDVAMDSYRYYSNYIDEEIRNGKSDSEVIEELGKPMLIARSIIAANTGQRQVDYEYTEDGRTKTVKNQGVFGNGNNSSTNNTSNTNTTTSNGKKFSFDFTGLLARAALVIFFMFLIIVVFFVIKIGFWVLVTFGIPILLILGIIYLVMYFSK